ncbi:MAG TPA: hypothetical protein PKY30_23750 [Myxococcota bacterium]|nr:hypothetical protein [Myxococcota bacterium]
MSARLQRVQCPWCCSSGQNDSSRNNTCSYRCTLACSAHTSRRADYRTGTRIYHFHRTITVTLAVFARSA